MKTIYKYIPYEKLTISSAYRAEEVLARIAQNTEMEMTFKKRFLGRIKMRSNNTYEGTVSDKGFEISRVIFYRNSFLPLIIGDVRDQPFGSEIDLTLRMNWVVIIFAMIWMGFVTLACLAVLVYILFTGEFDRILLMPFGMWLFGFVLFLGGFKLESIRSRNHLMELLNAQEKENYDL